MHPHPAVSEDLLLHFLAWMYDYELGSTCFLASHPEHVVKDIYSLQLSQLAAEWQPRL